MMEKGLMYTLIGIGIITIVFLIKKIIGIFKGKDKKLSPEEFLQMIGAGSLLIMSGYMIYKEANRAEAWQLFGPAYIFLVIGGFLTVVGLGKVLDTIVHIFGKDKKED